MRLAPTGEPNAMADAVSALVNLGYPQAMAWQALRAVEKQLPEGSESLRVEESDPFGPAVPGAR